jgi:nucleoside-diphosphate kinase
MGSRTLAIIKPDAVGKNAIGEIVAKITQAGFRILAMKMIKISKEQAGAFYEVHKERGFYNDLIEYMSSGTIVPIALEKDDAVNSFRSLIGSTDPLEAADGTIRKLWGTSKAFNAIHGSDSDDNAKIEIAFFFSKCDLVATGG